MARTKTIANPPPPLVNYRESYSWASDRLLAESSTLTSSEDWKDHTKSEPIGKAFGKDDDAYISVRPCVPGEPVCVNNRSNNGEPFFFFYQTVFKHVGQHLPFNRFERELLTELNVAPAQLHPNSWAFIRAFSLLMGYLGLSPSVDVFLHFFEAKSPGNNLWVSLSGVTGRVLFSLFQQSYKGFRGKFFRVCASDHDRRALDGFPLYWVEELKFSKAKTLDELSLTSRETCQVLAILGMIFNTAEIIKHGRDPAALAKYLGMGFLHHLFIHMLCITFSCTFNYACFIFLVHL